MSTCFVSRQRKNEIKDIVLDIIKRCNIRTLPIKLGDITKAYGIRCIKMDKITVRSSAAGSMPNDDGYIIQSGSGYVIVYNANHSRVRIRYTITCQLAHIFLGHLANGASDKATDLETKYFADELLMPLSVLDSFDCRKASEIAKRCDVSFTAATIRQRDFMRRDRYKKINGETEYDMEFLKCFFDSKDGKGTI